MSITSISLKNHPEQTQGTGSPQTSWGAEFKAGAWWCGSCYTAPISPYPNLWSEGKSLPSTPYCVLTSEQPGLCFNLKEGY